MWRVRLVLLCCPLSCTLAFGARADTTTALGDRGGEGSTPFTGLAQAPEANLFTGALTTAVPIEVPPGRRGMTPQLALRYSSNGGPSAFGYGWDLVVGRIERGTTWGVPRCTGAHTDDFVLVLPTGAAELVREAPGSTFYRPKVEQAWVRAELRASQNLWIVTDRSGLTYTFGANDSARVANSSPPVLMAQDPDGACRLTSQWALSKIADPNGNVIDVSWSNVLNALYPVTIRYGGNSQSNGPAHVYTVRFLYEYRPADDRQVSLRNGVAARLLLRVHEIDVETDVPSTGTAVRSYALQYLDDLPGAAPQGYQSILAAVTASGRPTQHFAYTPSVGGHRVGVGVARPAAAYGELRVSNASLEVSQTVLDMNGDGILDLVRSDDPSPSSWLVFFGFVSGGSFGFQSTGTVWQAPGNWLHLRNVVVSSGSCNGNGWSCTATDTFDITGDGIPDYVDAGSGATWTVYPGRGVPQWGFAPGVAWPAPNRQYIRRSYQGDAYQDVLDVNGDGLPDLVASGAPGQPAPYQWDVYLNTGSGFEPARLPRYPAPVNTLVDHIPGGLAHELLDFNGDGLPDLVRSGIPGVPGSSDPRCARSATAQASCLDVYFNTGQGFAAQPDATIPVPLSGTVQESDGTSDDRRVVQDLADINGDGLPDWIYRRYSYQLHDYEPEWRVLLNLGGTLEALTYVPHAAYAPPYTEGIPARVWAGGQGDWRRSVDGNSRTDLLDVNGDGFLDRVTAGGSTWNVSLNAAVERPNLLGLMENGLGGTNTIVYRPSTAYVNTGGDAQPDLPFITWVVDKTRQSDGLCTPPAGADLFTPGSAPAQNPCIDSGNELVARYAYQDGRFDPVEREFRGFRRVVRTAVEGSGAPGNQTVTYFGQAADSNGRILQVDTYAGSAVLVRSEHDFWGTRTVGGNRTQLWLAQNVRSTYDLIASGVPLVTQIINDPPDDYGNITHFYRSGLFDADRVDTYTTYALPQSGSPVYDRPASVRVQDAGGVLEEQWIYYDGSGANGLALGKVAAGNVKRLRARLTPSNASGPETKMAYDAFGNLTQVTDANGHATTTAYDSRALYPVRVTNPLGHVASTETDYRFAVPATVTDPNGAVTAHAYDAAGRRVCLARPGDSLTNCSVTYTYHFAAQPGELSWVEASERQDAPHPPRVTRYYFDALGRARYTDTSRVVDGLPTTVRSNQIVYDAGGRLRSVAHPYLADAGSANNGAVGYDYHLNGSPYVDPLGRLFRTTNADQTSRRTEYAAALTSSYDEEGQRTDTTTDAHGRITQQTVYDGGSAYATTTRSYDGTGRLLQLRQNGVAMQTIAYDSLGRKTQMTDADSGTWRYGYDGVGNLLWQDDPRPGRHVQFCYDALDRPTRRCPVAADFQQMLSCSLACGDPETVLYSYDSSAVPYAKGRLTAVSDAAGSTATGAYDARGRQLNLTRTIDAGSGGEARFEYTYDANDRVTSTRYPDGEVVLVDYDDAGQPIVLRNTGNDFYVTDARYDVFGRPTVVQHANGVNDTRVYGGAASQHRLQALGAARGATPLLDLSYDQYSPRGLLQRVTDHRNLLGDLTNTTALGYDALGRLTSFDSAQSTWDRAFAYDALGNLTRNGDRYLTYGNGTRPHQVTRVNVGSPTGGPLTVTHDANGNRLGKQSQSYEYDSGDRLAAVHVGAATAHFIYDYRGRQAAKVIDGNPAVVTRYYSELIETTSGYTTKWYFLGGLRIASQSSSYSGWEAPPGGFASLLPSSVLRPRIVLALAREAQWVLGAVFFCIALPLLVAPWRRRPVVGFAVRPGHAILVALACAVGTLPWPLVLAPAPALAGGYGGSVVRHYHADHLGSTQAISDRNGTLVEQIRYLPYGQIRGRWDGSGQPLGAPSTVNRHDFAGYETDTLSGLQYAGARFYDPELGQFLTHDPSTQFASPYSFGGGDPMNWSDPSGRDFIAGLLVALIISAIASAAINAVIAAAQGLPLSAIGKSALGGAIAGAIGVGLGVVASAAAMGAGAVAGTLSTSITLQSAMNQLAEVAYRSAFSTTIANAAGQTVSAAGAPSPLGTALAIAAGFAASVAFDRFFGQYVQEDIVRVDGGQNLCSTTADHTEVTQAAAADAGFSRADADTITAANLDRDNNLWNNQDHFDFEARRAAAQFKDDAIGMLSRPGSSVGDGDVLRAIGAGSHHVEDQFALGHTVPGTSLFRGPAGAPVRFLIHNLVGGEVTFRQAQYEATLKYFDAIRQAAPGGA